VAGWDGRVRTAAAEALIGPEPVYLWVGGETESPRVGEPFHASVKWFDPTGRAAGRRPTLVVRRAGVTHGELELLPVIGGLRSAAWRPTAPGDYELVATLPHTAGEPLSARETIHVAAGDAETSAGESPLVCEARLVRREGRPHVRVRLDGVRRQPLLLLLEAGGPLAAHALASLEGATELLVPLTPPAPGDLRLVLAEAGPDGAGIVGARSVRPDEDEALTLVLAGEPVGPAPGESLEIGVSCRRRGQPAHDAMLMARLADVSKSGGVQWVPGEGRPDLLRASRGIRFVSSTTADPPADGADVIVETRELSASMARAWFGSPTLWVASHPAAPAPVTFTVPVPPRPGLYRLIVTAQTPDGAFASRTLDLDTRQAPRMVADVPGQLALGDRTVAALSVTNPQDVELRARVTFDGGPGLQASEWRRVTRGGAAESATRDAPLALELAPGQTATLHVRVEATSSGLGDAAFLIEAGQVQHRATASYRVWADAAGGTSSDGDALVISRKLFLLEEDPSATDPRTTAATGAPPEREPQWLRFEIRPGERVAPGRLILVQEEFSLAEPLPRLRWEQRLPGNCHTHTQEWRELRQIGQRRGLGLQSLAHGTARLGSDHRHIHEYVIIPVRPGACRFPPPTVYSEDVPVRVDVQQSDERVIVADSN
jgi:hypothetical protein